MADTVNDLKSAASSYFAASQILSIPRNQHGNQFTFHVRPFITCLAFSAELYIKCLLAIDGKSGKELYGHNLKELYDDLSPQKKEKLKITHKEIFNKNFDHDYFFNKEHINAFVDWRYTQEFGDLKKFINTAVLADLIRLFSTQVEKEMKT